MCASLQIRSSARSLSRSRAAPRRVRSCSLSNRLANELLLEIFQHIVPGSLFTEDECRKMYLALAGTSTFFASIVTARRFRHVTASKISPGSHRRALDWIPLVDAGDRAALAVAQHVATLELNNHKLDSDPLRLALLRGCRRMPCLRSLVLVGWLICRDTVGAISRLGNLASLKLYECNLMQSFIPHLRLLRVPTFLLVACCSWGEDITVEQCNVARLVDTEFLRGLYAPALALSTWSLQSCAFPVLRKAEIKLPMDYSADLQKTVCDFLTSAVALETLQVWDSAEVPWDLFVPSTSLTRLTELKAPVHIFGPLAVGRSIRTLDLRQSHCDLPLGHMCSPGIMEVITRVEHMKISNLGGGILPHASRLETLHVEVLIGHDVNQVRVQ
jgi:hypothetical protein